MTSIRARQGQAAAIMTSIRGDRVTAHSGNALSLQHIQEMPCHFNSFRSLILSGYVPKPLRYDIPQLILEINWDILVFWYYGTFTAYCLEECQQMPWHIQGDSKCLGTYRVTANALAQTANALAHSGNTLSLKHIQELPCHFSTFRKCLVTSAHSENALSLQHMQEMPCHFSTFRKCLVPPIL
jgi:hypothetical protein